MKEQNYQKIIKELSRLIDIRQTPQYAKFMEKIGWKVIKRQNTYFYLRKLPFLPFFIIKILHPTRPLQTIKLKKIIKKYWPLFIKIQPFKARKNKNTPKVSELTPWRWRTDNHPLIPTKTLWIDLTKTQNKLLKKMKAKTRYNLRLGQKKAVKTIVTSGNKITSGKLNQFYSLWQKNKPFNWLFKPSFQELKYLITSFGQKCFFVFGVDSQEKLLAAVLILTSTNMAFYWHNCSSKKGKKLKAPTLVCWQAIKESKKRNLQIFDFEGVWDQRFPQINKGWQGFSRFKKNFGGKEIEFPSPKVARLFNLTYLQAEHNNRYSQN